jgi:hypothetical protein
MDPPAREQVSANDSCGTWQKQKHWGESPDAPEQPLSSHVFYLPFSAEHHTCGTHPSKNRICTTPHQQWQSEELNDRVCLVFCFATHTAGVPTEFSAPKGRYSDAAVETNVWQQLTSSQLTLGQSQGGSWGRWRPTNCKHKVNPPKIIIIKPMSECVARVSALPSRWQIAVQRNTTDHIRRAQWGAREMTARVFQVCGQHKTAEHKGRNVVLKITLSDSTN